MKQALPYLHEVKALGHHLSSSHQRISKSKERLLAKDFQTPHAALEQMPGPTGEGSFSYPLPVRLATCVTLGCWPAPLRWLEGAAWSA